jgi:hypothetical protein
VILSKGGTLAVIVRFIFFAVICLYLLVDDACWWLEVFLCKVDFVVFNTFAVSFIVRLRTVGFFRFTSVVVAVQVVVVDMMVLILLSMLAFLVSCVVSALSISVLSISVLLTLSVVRSIAVAAVPITVSISVLRALLLITVASCVLTVVSTRTTVGVALTLIDVMAFVASSLSVLASLTLSTALLLLVASFAIALFLLLLSFEVVVIVGQIIDIVDVPLGIAINVFLLPGRDTLLEHHKELVVTESFVERGRKIR